MPDKRPKRPRDPAQLAKLMIDIASGEVEDRERTPEEQGKNPHAAALGRKGGQARNKAIGAERRVEIARKAAQKRWGKRRGPAKQGLFMFKPLSWKSTPR
jgi:hypothetical protein